MAKKRERCVHGNAIVHLQGCAYCVAQIMQASGILRAAERELGLTPEDVVRILKDSPEGKKASTAGAAVAPEVEG